MFMNKPSMYTTTNIKTETITIAGTRLYIATQPGDGAGPPLLLINGLGANLEMFHPFLNALGNVGGQRIGTIRFDVPGVGGSPTPSCPFRFPGLARLISQLLDQLALREVDVLGISWGGGLAQQFAYQYPHRCRRLILVATSTGAVSVPGNPTVLAKLLSPRRYFQPSYLSEMAPVLYGGKRQQNSDFIRTYVHLARAPGGLGYYWQLMTGVGWTSIHWLHRLGQPTLILAGDDDPLVPAINARIMAQLIPNATLQVVNGGGHLFLLAQAEEVAPLVHLFLTRSL